MSEGTCLESKGLRVTAKVKRYSEDDGPGLHLWRKGDIERISHTVEQYCCDEMRDAVDEQVVVLGEADSCLNKDRNVNIVKCNAWPEGASYEEHAIRFCPFCGLPIEINTEDGHERSERSGPLPNM